MQRQIRHSSTTSGITIHSQQIWESSETPLPAPVGSEGCSVKSGGSMGKIMSGTSHGCVGTISSSIAHQMVANSLQGCTSLMLNLWYFSSPKWPNGSGILSLCVCLTLWPNGLCFFLFFFFLQRTLKPLPKEESKLSFVACSIGNRTIIRSGYTLKPEIYGSTENPGNRADRTGSCVVDKKKERFLMKMLLSPKQ